MQMYQESDYGMFLISYNNNTAKSLSTISKGNC